MARVRGVENETTDQRFMALMRTARLTGWRRHQPVPRKPDFVWSAAKVAVFVDGCFWHGHDCGRNVTPRTNATAWLEKINRNRARDRRVDRALRCDGWSVRRVWECALTRTPERCVARIRHRITEGASNNSMQRSGRRCAPPMMLSVRQGRSWPRTCGSGSGRGGAGRTDSPEAEAGGGGRLKVGHEKRRRAGPKDGLAWPSWGALAWPNWGGLCGAALDGHSDRAMGYRLGSCLFNAGAQCAALMKPRPPALVRQPLSVAPGRAAESTPRSRWPRWSEPRSAPPA